MAISDDFLIDAEHRLIRHETGNTVYTVNELYTYIQDYFDDIMFLSYTVPMSAQTPSEYSLINGWFIPDASFRFLSGGAIKTLGQNDEIFIVKFDSMGYVFCIPSDIGKTVVAGSSEGILLDYDNVLQKWWIRKNINTIWSGPAMILFGTGEGNIPSFVTGESTFANIFTIGELESTTTNILYIEQINPELINNRINQFWSAGHIDILLKVKEADSLISDGIVRVYCREYGNIYTHYTTNLSYGGRNPIPLSTLSDDNNKTSSIVVNEWNDVTITSGSIIRDIGDGVLRSYSIEIDCGFRTTLKEVYERLKLITTRDSIGEFYRSAQPSYSNVLQSPYGTFSGGKFYGARGVWLKNVPYIDINNYQVTSNDNEVTSPKFTSIGTLIFDSNLTDPASSSIYRLFFNQISTNLGTCKFGTEKAVLVKMDNNTTDIMGQINNTSKSFDFDFDGNPQARWLPSHIYVIGDEFRNGITWYRVSTSYISTSAFGITDITNIIEIDGPTVVLVAIGLAKAQYISATGMIARITENRISVDAAPELNYIT